MTELTKEQLWSALQEVKDPEIPSVSVVDMGMVMDVVIAQEGKVEIHMIPTFVGCPALGIIRKEVEKCLYLLPKVNEVEVKFVFDIPWTSDRITDEGRENLKTYGIAPPPKHIQIGDPWVVDCPYCKSPKTVMENLFGPTACRSILYCTSCKNPFEAIKPI